MKGVILAGGSSVALGGLIVETFRSQAEYQRHLEISAAVVRERRLHEQNLATGREVFPVPGRCFVCDREVEFLVDYQYAYPVNGVLTPNWRERLACPRCGLNNRMRATIHVIEELIRPARWTRVYLTEQTTPLYRWARKRFWRAVGSEWLGDCPPGTTNAEGIRHEDLTRLSFPDASFDLLVCLDVLEHVPDFQAALGECLRVLAPGAHLLVTVPFRPDRASNLVRAILRGDGTIEHREPPEYHGNPVSSEGSLAFHHFGWELLDQMRAVGFEDVRAVQYWSRELGYLGDAQLVFMARKRGGLLGRLIHTVVRPRRRLA